MSTSEAPKRSSSRRQRSWKLITAVQVPDEKASPLWTFFDAAASPRRRSGGFTDAAAAGRWHSFEVGRTFRIGTLLRDVEPLILDRRLVVEIDGARVRVGIGSAKAG